MSFRIAIPRPPRLQRQSFRSHKLSIVNAASSHRQVPPSNETSQPNPLLSWMYYLRSQGDLKDIREYGKTLRSVFHLGWQSEQKLDFRIQELVGALMMMAFFPFVSFVLLVDSASQLVKGLEQAKLYQHGVCGTSLVILCIFPIATLLSSTVAGLIVIFEEELAKLPLNTTIQRIELEDKCTRWMNDLYAGLVSSPSQDKKDVIEPEQTPEPAGSMIAKIALPSHSSGRSTTTSPVTRSETTVAPLTPSESISFIPITFPKITIQPQPQPPKPFDAEGWLIVSSPIDDSIHCGNPADDSSK